MAANLEITKAQFESEVLNSDVPVLVDFWAPWCGPCKAIGPSIEALANEYQGKAKVFKVDVDKEPELAQEYNVMSIPALKVFKGGKLVDQHTGAAQKPVLEKLITNHL